MGMLCAQMIMYVHLYMNNQVFDAYGTCVYVIRWVVTANAVGSELMLVWILKESTNSLTFN